MRTGSAQAYGSGPTANQIARISWMGKQQIWASPQQFLLISSRSRGKLPAGVYSRRDYCPALRILGVLGDPVPRSAYRGSSGQFPEWLTFYVSDL